ncbi:MAG: hypothetical protein WCJ58_00645 [bacterium]
MQQNTILQGVKNLTKKIKKWHLIMLFGLIIIMFVNGTPFYFGDAYGYYHPAKTLATQNSLISDTIPEYKPYAGHGVVIRQDGQAASFYPPGTAILWYPFLKVASFFDSGTIYTNYFKAFNGHSLADGLAVLAASTFYTYAAILLLEKLLRQKGFSLKVSLIAISSAYFVTFAFSYVTEQPGYAHPYEIFAFTLFLFLLEKFRKTLSNKVAIGVGFAAAMLVTIRSVDFVLFLPMLIVMLKYWKKAPWFILGTLPFIGFLFYYNYQSYGNILATGYQALGGQNFNFRQFKLFQLLFSDFRGLFIWSPAVLLALFAIWKKSRTSWNICIYALPPLFLILIYCFWPVWWAGDSIGARFFIVLLPIVAYGLALLFQNYQTQKNKWLLVIVIATISYSMLLGLLQRFSPTNRLSASDSPKALHFKSENIDPQDLASPLDMLRYQKTLITNAQSLSDYYQQLQKGFNGGRSLLLISLGMTNPLAIAKVENIDKIELNYLANPGSKKSSGNLDLYFQNKDYYLEFANVDFSQNHSYLIDCSSEFCQTIPTANIIHVNKMIEPDQYQEVTGHIKIYLEGEEKIRIANDKL